MNDLDGNQDEDQLQDLRMNMQEVDRERVLPFQSAGYCKAPC